MFKKILIANRGEIAVRIIRACRDLGVSPVAVYSEIDQNALHVKLADEARLIGPASPAGSYLSIERIIEAAVRSGAEAIHPGYGFLSENEQLAEACEAAKLVFVGPSAAAMRLMGNKIAARATARHVGVPLVPGTDGPLTSFDDCRRRASQVGFPVMLKASAGGGGKGLRLVGNEAELRRAYETACGEAKSAFNDPTLFLEKYLHRPRHIEVQILGDLFGNLIHLYERECSIQRRHQKLVEESPSPGIDAAFRARLGEAALKIAKAANYHNAGTVEFIVDTSGSSREPHYYFLEMNTRLQVEHPVTELATGIDMVREQIRIATGEKLGSAQEDIQLQCAAIECRVYAEDPRNNFFPSAGTITTYFEPSGPGIRIDSGVFAGAEIPVEYDPLISKVVAFGQDRKQAISRMVRALGEYRIGGPRTTLPFFPVLLSHPEFLKGNLHTHFIDEHRLIAGMEEDAGDGPEVALIAAVLNHIHGGDSPLARRPPQPSPWKYYGRPPVPFRR